MLTSMKVCQEFFHFSFDPGVNIFLTQRLGCPSASRKFILILLFLSILTCFFMYHISTYNNIILDNSSGHPRPVNVSTISASVKLKIQEASVAGNGASLHHLKFRGTQRRFPQAIIIGARKCGTRALLEMMALHPYVLKNAAEMHFFDDDTRYENGLEWYRKKMPFSFDNQITIEKTPSYFVSRAAPSRIRAMNATIRLVLIVRDPARRVLSDYAQIAEARRRHGKDVQSLKQKVFDKDGRVNENFQAIRISQYFVHLVRWLRVFPLEQILVIDGEKLVANPYLEIKKVESFLRLPSRLTPSNFYFNATKGFYCLRNDTLRKCLPPSKGRSQPIADAEMVTALRKYFAPFNDHFYDLIGQNFSWPTS